MKNPKALAVVALMLITGISLTGCPSKDTSETTPATKSETTPTTTQTPPLETEAKPVIYLYPERETNVTINLDLDGFMTCSYPKYDEGWHVTAFPDGRIFDKGTNRFYDYLFWEGKRSFEDYAFTQAACVARDNSVSFLEEYLSASGLNDSEIDDFISYWLPKLEASPYNLISFPNTQYVEWAKLDVFPQPDTEIRVYMVFAPLEESMEIPEEMLLETPAQPERKGFTLVEWGGTATSVKGAQKSET